ncbi:GGDEF domain-containing phosphodiesterase [Sandarakinorhabdus sp.]|uniref:putative bifunctional diguanylate cyclase/phosphodiesterase n=1 Tax=Sandarakinorhabdus sp. TaxID=1916663 RepID=UPI00286E3602|nr:GGDEF domain-containing phosphodiesterase [Sandarakinorhabdus sp.]
MMTRATNEPVLIISTRYADDVARMVTEASMGPRIERRADAAAERFQSEPVRMVVVDCRGALELGLGVAKSLGPAVEERCGAMLVMLSRTDGESVAAAREAGATGVLVSPFGGEAFANALALAVRHADRLENAASQGDRDILITDRLTGLATGKQLNEWVSRQLAKGRSGVFVVAIGVGRFAQINAAYGRDVGDRLLGALAMRMSHIVDARHEGVDACLLARLAAAEFGFALAGDVSRDDAEALARQLVEGFSRPFAIDDRLIHLSGRAGLASAEALPGSDAMGLVHRAGVALANARGREAGAVAWFETSPGGDPLTRLADLESDLHSAMVKGGITLMFQPQLSVPGGSIMGAEALVRWEHPEFGQLSATTLLATAASAELALELGRYIRAQAIATAANWTGPEARLKLSLNVTAADLADPLFIETLAANLAQAGFAPNRLVLEVTEDALIEDMEAAAALLDVLRRDGVQVALDDFGTGYSSLARLAKLPVDILKLDRSLTLCLSGTERERILVEAVVAAGRRLGLSVIAEGVEDAVQLAAARAAGCDGVQGFCVAPPLDAAGLRAFCRTRQMHLPAMGG